VDSTAAPNDNSVVHAVDATALSKEMPQVAAVEITSVVLAVRDDRSSGCAEVFSKAPESVLAGTLTWGVPHR
jgi:hypothetical protein